MNHDIKVFLQLIHDLSQNSKIPFAKKAKDVDEFVKNLNRDKLIHIVKEVGMIPEIIEAGSTEEKLFSKASDCVLDRCFIEFGLQSIAITRRILRYLHLVTGVAGNMIMPF